MTTAVPDPRQNGSGTAVVDFEQIWRGRQDQNNTSITSPDVPLPEETAFIPSFTLSWPFDWALLANGERSFDEAAALARIRSAPPNTDADEEKFESLRLMNDGTENVKTHAEGLKIGENYLTSTGLPVRLIRAEGAAVVLQNLATADIIVLPASYPLEPFIEGEATLPVRVMPCEGPGSRTPVAQARKLLAPIIDALLLKGGISMLGVVRAVKRRASASCRGKDVKANVRARIYWLKRRGFTIDTDEIGRLKATPPYLDSEPTTAPVGSSITETPP